MYWWFLWWFGSCWGYVGWVATSSLFGHEDKLEICVAHATGQGTQGASRLMIGNINAVGYMMFGVLLGPGFIISNCSIIEYII
jgi:hypothetical protein